MCPPAPELTFNLDHSVVADQVTVFGKGGCGGGVVTNLKIGRHEALDSIGSHTDGYSLSPLTKSIVLSFAMLGRGDQMTAGVEGVVDGGMD